VSHALSCVKHNPMGMICNSAVGILPDGSCSFKQDLNWEEHCSVFKKWVTEMLPCTHFHHPLFLVYIIKDAIDNSPCHRKRLWWWRGWTSTELSARWCTVASFDWTQSSLAKYHHRFVDGIHECCLECVIMHLLIVPTDQSIAELALLPLVDVEILWACGMTWTPQESHTSPPSAISTGCLL
jgi:hypothetical protein